MRSDNVNLSGDWWERTDNATCGNLFFPPFCLFKKKADTHKTPKLGNHKKSMLKEDY